MNDKQIITVIFGKRLNEELKCFELTMEVRSEGKEDIIVLASMTQDFGGTVIDGQKVGMLFEALVEKAVPFYMKQMTNNNDHELANVGTHAEAVQLAEHLVGKTKPN